MLQQAPAYIPVFRKLATLTSEALLREKKSSDKMLPPVSIEPLDL